MPKDPDFTLSAQIPTRGRNSVLCVEEETLMRMTIAALSLASAIGIARGAGQHEPPRRWARHASDVSSGASYA